MISLYTTPSRHWNTSGSPTSGDPTLINFSESPQASRQEKKQTWRGYRDSTAKFLTIAWIIAQRMGRDEIRQDPCVRLTRRTKFGRWRRMHAQVYILPSVHVHKLSCPVTCESVRRPILTASHDSVPLCTVNLATFPPLVSIVAQMNDRSRVQSSEHPARKRNVRGNHRDTLVNG